MLRILSRSENVQGRTAQKEVSRVRHVNLRTVSLVADLSPCGELRASSNTASHRTEPLLAANRPFVECDRASSRGNVRQAATFNRRNGVPYLMRGRSA